MGLVHPSAERRDPETILADFMAMYNGSDKQLDDYRLEAKAMIQWLKDEGWTIHHFHQMTTEEWKEFARTHRADYSDWPFPKVQAEELK